MDLFSINLKTSNPHIARNIMHHPPQHPSTTTNMRIQTLRVQFV